MYSMGASVKADRYARTTKAIAEYVLGQIDGHDMKMLAAQVKVCPRSRVSLGCLCKGVCWT
jgi:hypothetical protein